MPLPLPRRKHFVAPQLSVPNHHRRSSNVFLGGHRAHDVAAVAGVGVHQTVVGSGGTHNE